MTNRLAEIRKNNKMTQKELADKVGLTPKAISFYELGQREISNDLLIKFSKIFNVSIDYLLGKEPNEIEENEKVKILAREANDLTDVQIDLINNMIAEFKKQNNKE